MKLTCVERKRVSRKYAYRYGCLSGRENGKLVIVLTGIREIVKHPREIVNREEIFSDYSPL